MATLQLLIIKNSLDVLTLDSTQPQPPKTVNFVTQPDPTWPDPCPTLPIVFSGSVFNPQNITQSSNLRRVSVRCRLRCRWWRRRSEIRLHAEVTSRSRDIEVTSADRSGFRRTLPLVVSDGPPDFCRHGSSCTKISKYFIIIRSVSKYSSFEALDYFWYVVKYHRHESSHKHLGAS